MTASERLARWLYDVADGMLRDDDHALADDGARNRQRREHPASPPAEPEDRQQAGAVSRMYVANRVFGFNTYGEQFRAAHMNQTFTGLAVGR